jgi:hypothetical protein
MDSWHSLLSQIRDYLNLECQVLVFISPRNSVAQLYRQTLGTLYFSSYDSEGYGGGIRPRLHIELALHICRGYSASARTVEKTLHWKVSLLLHVDSLLQKHVYHAVA